ncbi:MAG: GNAT family N-acetyltransferase [Lacisediminihabitans sp.]
MTTLDARLRDLTAADIPLLLDLNNAAAPAVPMTSQSEMAVLLKLSDVSLAAVDEADDRLLGFVLGMKPGSDYQSENYRYFESRGTDHLYVDRIVVAEVARGRGIGRQLYAAVFDLARAEARPEVTCEVNLDPPNPESLAFHARLGFQRIGEQATKNATVTVALLAAPVG